MSLQGKVIGIGLALEVKEKLPDNVNIVSHITKVSDL